MGRYKPMGVGAILENAYENAKSVAEDIVGYSPSANPFVLVLLRNGKFTVAGDSSLPTHAAQVALAKARLAAGAFGPGIAKLYHRSSFTPVGLAAVATRTPRPDIEEHLVQEAALAVLLNPAPLKF